MFLLEPTDAKGATVVVPVTLDSRDKLGIQLNIAKRAYAKERNGIPSDGCFIKQAKKCPLYKRANVEASEHRLGSCFSVGCIQCFR